jgi:glycosyltransferase involved in cell wall biosynthesis
LVVDNASTDGTASLVKDVLDDAVFDWQILKEDQPGLIHARLCGLHAAKYPILLYCDDDNSLDRNYLQIGYDLMKENMSIGALGGCGVPVFESEKPDWFDFYSHSFAVGPQSNKEGFLQEHPGELYGAGTFFRKKPLLEFINNGLQMVMSGRKGKTLASGEDVEWCYLIQLLGYKVYYDHRLTFLHDMPEGRMNWSYYLRLKQGISSGVCRLLSYHCLFKNTNSGQMYFCFLWFKGMSHSALIYLKLNILQVLYFKKQSTKNILATVIWKAKAKSYWRDALTSYNHFKNLKSIMIKKNLKRYD